MIIAGIGFAGSYTALRDLAIRQGFGTFAYLFPIGIDAGICVLLALDLLLTYLRIPFPLLRPTAWLLTAATIAFNAATAWPDPLGVGMHGVIPLLFIVTVEAARHAIGRIADQHMEGVRLARWLLSPLPTLLLWRRMKLWELRSYQQAIKLEQERLVYQARLHSRFGRAWRRKAPVESLLPLRLARHGITLADTAPAGLTAADIEPELPPPAPHPTTPPPQQPTPAQQPTPEKTSSIPTPAPRPTRKPGAGGDPRKPAKDPQQPTPHLQTDPDTAQWTPRLRGHHSTPPAVNPPLARTPPQSEHPTNPAHHTSAVNDRHTPSNARTLHPNTPVDDSDQPPSRPDSTTLATQGEDHHRRQPESTTSDPCNPQQHAPTSGAHAHRTPPTRPAITPAAQADRSPRAKTPAALARDTTEPPGLTTVDRYYLAWTTYQTHHGTEPTAQQLSTYLAAHGLHGRNQQPISPANLRRHFLPWRIYNLWTKHRKETPAPSP
ncbi:DUF2637 domain-containing protein [Streptomyces sp. NPDC002144]